MIIPQYWAEARIHQKVLGRSFTVRRYGWSDHSQEEAQHHANQRTTEAFQKIIAGEKLNRRDPKVPYNGADGLPIREEIISQHGNTIITRNSYGALCLNSPNVAFIDIDFSTYDNMSFKYIWITFIPFAIILLMSISEFEFDYCFLLFVIFISFLFHIWRVWKVKKLWIDLRGGITKLIYRKLQHWMGSHPDWRIRIYRTPAGLRILILHQLFQPQDTDILACFQALYADPVYVQMCLNQNCFRARVSPKPWRIGMPKHISPRPGTWPIHEALMPKRLEWLAQYEHLSQGFASCRFLEEIGDGPVHPQTIFVQKLHDQLCQAESHLPIA